MIVNRKSPKPNAKKAFLFNLIDTKKSSTPTKIVNLSFALNYTPQKSVLEKSNILPSRVNFFDAGNHARDESWRYEGPKFNETMRRTFNSGMKEAKEREKEGAHSRVNMFTMKTFLSTKKASTPK